jgi:hypothetical protein
MYATTSDMTHKNIARTLGISDYSELVNAGVEKEKEMVKSASKKLSIKKLHVSNYSSSGNPYVMLGLKVNTKGKRVK